MFDKGEGKVIELNMEGSCNSASIRPMDWNFGRKELLSVYFDSCSSQGYAVSLEAKAVSAFRFSL